MTDGEKMIWAAAFVAALQDGCDPTLAVRRAANDTRSAREALEDLSETSLAIEGNDAGSVYTFLKEMLND